MVSLQQIKKDYQEICEKVAACKTVGDLQRLSQTLNTPIVVNGRNINGAVIGNIRVEKYGALDYIRFLSDDNGVYRCATFCVKDKENRNAYDNVFLSGVTIDTLDEEYQKAISDRKEKPTTLNTVEVHAKKPPELERD